MDGSVPSIDAGVCIGVIFTVPKSGRKGGAVFHQFRNTSTQTTAAGMRKTQQVMMPKIMVRHMYGMLRCE